MIRVGVHVVFLALHVLFGTYGACAALTFGGALVEGSSTFRDASSFALSLAVCAFMAAEGAKTVGEIRRELRGEAS